MNRLIKDSEYIRTNNKAYSDALDFVSDLLSVDPCEMIKKNRRRELSTARHALAYYLRKHTDLSFEVIGELMGGRHHATIIHGCKFINESAPYNSYIKLIKDSIDNLFMPKTRNLRQEILRCLKMHTTDNVRTEAIIKVINIYVRKRNSKESTD